MASALAQADAEAEALALRLRLAPPAPSTADQDREQALYRETLDKLTAQLQPRQRVAAKSTADQIFYGGAAGGGKSWLARYMAIRAAIVAPGCQIYLARRTSDDLDDHLDGDRRFPEMLSTLVDAGLVNIRRSSPKRIEFSNGSIIHLRHFENYGKHQKNFKREIHLLIGDEAGDFESRMLLWMAGRVRLGSFGETLKDAAPEGMALVPRCVFLGNPKGICHGYLKRTFVDPSPAEKPFKEPERLGGKTLIFVPALMEDNKYIDAEAYRRNLLPLGEEMYNALAGGAWEGGGGAFFSEFERPAFDGDTQPACVIEPFSVPVDWPIWRCYDHGLSKPWYCGWVTVANGEDVTLASGETWAIPRGSVIWIGELYGLQDGEHNVGNRWGVRKISQEIMRWEYESNLSGRVSAGPADGIHPGNKTDSDQVVLLDTMRATASPIEVDESVGIDFIEPIKAPGTRVQRWQLWRELLLESAKEEPDGPVFLAFNTCRHLIRTMFEAPADKKKPDDIDTECEDHPLDVAGYALLYIKSQRRTHGTIRAEDLSRAMGRPSDPW